MRSSLMTRTFYQIFFFFYLSTESLRKGCWGSLKGEEGTKGEMIGRGRSVGTGKRRISLR